MVAQPPLDDAGAHSGKPPKSIKIRFVRRSLWVVLYRAVHYEEWSGSLPHDLINMAVGDAFKGERSHGVGTDHAKITGHVSLNVC